MIWGSCELLSIWLLLWISHSKKWIQKKCGIVVNCFQFDYFCGYHTASRMRALPSLALWIAFNLITFVDITQHIYRLIKTGASCELLSIWLLLWISHSLFFILHLQLIVVNCFQFDYFCGYHTARPEELRNLKMLWIAFNLITFVDITQHEILSILKEKGCELLSIWLLLWISHSTPTRQ